MIVVRKEESFLGEILFSDKIYNYASAKRVVIGCDKKEKKRINKKNKTKTKNIY